VSKPPVPHPIFNPPGKVNCSSEQRPVAHPKGKPPEPKQNFYAPGAKDEPSPDTLHAAMLNDQAIVIQYLPGAPASAVASLRTLANELDAAIVMQHPSPDGGAVEAFTATRHLICDGLDLDQLKEFAGQRGI
jgi:hypothetical protein